MEYYNTLNGFLQDTFHKKIAKISLDGGFSCPNRQHGGRGCSFCSAEGSGEFAGNALESIGSQIAKGKERTAKKWPQAGYIAYFQAYTNTFAPVAVLRAKYEEALAQPNILGLAIATRPDCLPTEVLDLLEELSHKTFLWVELGFQTAKEETAKVIRRGYETPCFAAAVQNLHGRGIPVVAHTILGLPGETKEDMLATMDYINALPVWGIKLHLLYLAEGTDICADYCAGKFQAMSLEAYIKTLCACVNRLRPDIIIHRLTGDGPRSSLVAPLWSLKKWEVLNSIHDFMKENGVKQGKDYFQGTKNLI